MTAFTRFVTTVLLPAILLVGSATVHALDVLSGSMFLP